MFNQANLFSAINRSPLFRILRIAIVVLQLVEFVREPDLFWLPLPAGSVKQLERALSGPQPLRAVRKRGVPAGNHAHSHARYCDVCAVSSP